MGEELNLNDRIDVKSSSEIVIDHIQHYLKKMTKVLFASLISITIAEILILVLVRFGHFTYYLKMHNNASSSFLGFIIEIIGHNALVWIVFALYCVWFKKANFRTRKVLLSLVYMIITTILCFGHWKYSYLSILYSIPVCISSPLGRKHSRIIFVISILIAILYAIFQSFTFSTEYNFLICVVSILTIIVFYFISRIFFVSMTSAIYDIEKYCVLSEDLQVKVQHDSLTGAFSKIALYKDFEDIKRFKSMAFIDLDNFKEINDSQGHSTGDYILKTLVRCFKIKKENIYRYGGDEFVILSKKDEHEFKKELIDINQNFTNISNTVLNCKTSFSAGIIKISESDNADLLIKKCDKAMYVAKKSGRVKVTLAEEIK